MPYLIRKEVVARSLRRLREAKTHTNFAGYLYLQHRSARLERLDDLQPDFPEYFRFFYEVPDHPPAKPYIKPFTEETASPANLWLNENIAGSYAPSSLRANQPFRQVVDIDGEGRYTLPPTHASLAVKYLLYEQRVSAADLAVFLYRDFALTGDSPTIHDVVGIFATEFGYRPMSGGEFSDDFNTLFYIETADNWGSDWLEKL